LTLFLLILNLFSISRPILLAIYLTFMPLQGFWFLVIFCNGKVQIIRRARRDCSYLKALRLIFASSDYPDVIFSNITLVERERDGISIDDLSEGSSHDKSATKDFSGISYASSANDYLSSNLSWSLNHTEDKGDLSHNMSLNHMEGEVDLSLDGDSFNDDCGSKVSVGVLSKNESLFVLSSNRSRSLNPLDEERSSGDM